MTILLTNPKRSGDLAYIKIIRPDGAQLWMAAGSNARRYAKRHQEAICERAGSFFEAGQCHALAALFSRCKGRVEAHRKINGMWPAMWEGME